MKILKSASKIVFLALALTACVGFFLGKLEKHRLYGISS